jgi:FkbM family methyltransferase
MKFVGPTKLEVHPHEGLTGCWYVGLPEYDEMTFLLRFLRKEDVLYDVGANAGSYSILALGCGCRVVAMEPVPATFARLQANVELNRASDLISALNLAAGQQHGHVRMSTHLGTGNRVLAEDEVQPGIEVEIITLDEVAETHPAPTFLKIDVEGHEIEVLRGARKVLGRPGLEGLLIETFRSHNWALPRMQELEAVLAGHGFRPCAYDAEKNVLRELETKDSGPDNTFYLRDPAAVKRRLNEAPKRELSFWTE